MMKILLLSLALLSLLSAPAAESAAAAKAPRRSEYLILSDTLGQPGRQTVEESADGWVSVKFIYKNNGRGPELTERYRLAADGSYAEYHSTGTSTYGNPIDEHFQRKGELATWHSAAEKGEARVQGAAMYLPINSSYSPQSVFAAALARRPEGSMPLLPGGTLRIRKLADVEVRSADGRRKQQVRLLAQTGVGLQPFFYWVSTGPAVRLFAVADLQGEITIEAGWQGNRKLLEERQRAAEQALQREQAQRLRHPLPGLTVIRNARVFDSETATLANAPSDVYLIRGRISQILPAGSLKPEADQAEQEIDAAGRVLLPGLFDMHGHIGRWSTGALNLAAGVTSVRDMGNDNAMMQAVLDEVRAGTLLMPRITPSGFLEGRSPMSSAFGITISTLDEARKAIDWYAQRGYPQLKVYNSFPKDILRQTVAYAHSRGMRVSGHVPAFMRADEVLDQGFDEIQHINQLLLNFLVTPETDTRTLERFKLPAEKVAELDFDSAPVQAFIATLAQRQTVVDATLATFDFIHKRDGVIGAPYVAAADHLPPDLRRVLLTGAMAIPDDATHQRYQRSYAKMIDFIGRLHRAGVPLVAGTDDFPGFVLHAELALYVQAGISPAQALQIATRNGARYTGTSHERGSISPGKLADLVLVDGDPTSRIADLGRIALVITQEHWFSPRELHESIGIKPFVDSVPAVRAKAR